MKSSAKVLIVEDESIVALDLEQQLLDLGYSVPTILASGEQAVAYAQNEVPDLILMDIQLQDEMDGITAVKEIKKTMQVPVIYLTAFADQATLYRARETEPHGYLVKPFNDETLRTTVEMALYKFKSERKLQNYTTELEQKNLLLQLLNRLVKIDVDVTSRKDLLRLACNGLVEALNIPYTFAISIKQFNSTQIILFERLKENARINSSNLSDEAYQICQKYFMRSKPWIVQNVQRDPCLNILIQYKTRALNYELFILPIVVEDEVVGAIGLGAEHIEDISVNDIRAAWNVVSEIVNTLENINTTGTRQRMLEVLFHSDISIVCTDQQGLIEFVNPAFENNTGYHLHELSGYPLLSAPILLGTDDQTKNNALQYAISKGTSWFGKLDIKPKDRSPIPTEVVLWPVFDASQIELAGNSKRILTGDIPSIISFICFIQTHHVSSNSDAVYP